MILPVSLFIVHLNVLIKYIENHMPKKPLIVSLYLPALKISLLKIYERLCCLLKNQADFVNN